MGGRVPFLSPTLSRRAFHPTPPPPHFPSFESNVHDPNTNRHGETFPLFQSCHSTTIFFSILVLRMYDMYTFSLFPFIFEVNFFGVVVSSIRPKYSNQVRELPRKIRDALQRGKNSRGGEIVLYLLDDRVMILCTRCTLPTAPIVSQNCTQQLQQFFHRSHV